MRSKIESALRRLGTDAAESLGLAPLSKDDALGLTPLSADDALGFAKLDLKDFFNIEPESENEKS